MRIDGLDLYAKTGNTDYVDQLKETIQAGATQAADSTQAAGSAGSADSAMDFNNIIEQGIQKVDAPQQDFNIKIQDFLQGKEQLHNVMLSADKAKFDLDLTMKVRDKIIEAYQSVMKMQV
jgi:flagellar hook-basal body complex protein FliE